MSAFLLISATAPKKHKRPSSNGLSGNARIPRSASASIGGASSFSGYSTDCKSGSRASVKSAGGASSNTGSARSSESKTYFDTEKLKYVECGNTLSLFERKLLAFSDEVISVKLRSIGEPAIKILNDTMRSDSQVTSGQLLLTTDNLERLRFNYFEKFEPDHQRMKARIATKQPGYAEIIQADMKMDAKVLEESFPNPAAHKNPTSFTMSKPSLAADTARAKVASLENRLFCPSGPSADHTSGIRGAFHLVSFWDDIYHDMKCETYNSEYYTWLPSRQMTQRIFIEIADFALYRLREVTCTVSASEAGMLNEDERNELARNSFFYFQNSDTTVIECLSLFAKSQFLSQMQTRAWNDGTEHLREVLAALTRCVGENLTLHFYGHSRAEATTDLFCEFLLCIFDAIVLDFAKVIATQEENVTPVSSMASVFERSLTNGTTDENYTVSPHPKVKKQAVKETTTSPQKPKKGLFGRFRS